MILDIKNITGVSIDSRKIEPGNAFVAVKGENFDGARFIDQAIKNGARLIVLDKSIVIKEQAGVIYQYVENTKKTLALLANKLYQPQPSEIVAVTGTNGKTSTANFFMQMCHMNGLLSSSVGTLGTHCMGIKKVIESSGLTTPDAISLNKTLNILQKNGVTHVAIEASSHGLDLHRMDAVKLKAGGFTNISQDHLDYHGTHEKYFIAKQRLFKELLPSGSVAVLNRDIQEYEKLKEICQNRNIKIIKYGEHIKSDLRIKSILNTCLKLEIFGKEFDVKFQLPGKFQIYNALCALGLCIALSTPYKNIVTNFSKISSVSGRMEKVKTLDNGASVFVDYAHTPDALKNSLISLKSVCKNNLHLVFGCGGQRDMGKRKLMGEIAEKFANSVIITDDNPRNENPGAIRSMIRKGCPSAQETPNREVAIISAIKQLQEEDILLIAGKGHEEYQIVGNEKLHFSDRKIVEKASQ